MAVIKYRPAIDGLRSVAVLSVFIFHLHRNWMPGGFVGVDVFFVVSGFLITSIIHGELLQDQFSLAKFYQRRISRIFPAFLVVALATFLAGLLICLPRDVASCGASLAAAALSVVNIKLITQGNYFEVQPDAQPFLHYWSLSVEEQYYMVFPLSMLLLYRFARRALVPILTFLLIASLAASVLMTHTRPVLAFYLLPTRGWELLAGALLAIVSSSSSQRKYAKQWDLLAIAGLAMIVASFFIIREGPAFPGWIAMLPVVGCVLIIGPNSGSNGMVEGLLAQPFMAFIGRLSYSLYLWHWPVFSFVDYAWYQAPDWQRLPLKVVMSFGAAIACYIFIEKPARQLLNQRSMRSLTFAALPVVLVVLTAIGFHARYTYYVSSTMATTARGGVVIGEDRKAGSLALVGDSNGSMYGTGMREIADQLQYELVVLSVPGADPLPWSNGRQNGLWLDTLAAVKKHKPSVLVLVCDWDARLSLDHGRIGLALKALRPYTHKIIMITKPPIPPANATREAMRNGARPPFVEGRIARSHRLQMNQLVKSCASDKVRVLDLEPLFRSPDGGIRWKDDRGRLLYSDRCHLSPYGAELILIGLRDVITAKNHLRGTQTSGASSRLN